MWSLFRRKAPFAVFFLPPAAFSLPRKEKGAEYRPFGSLPQKTSPFWRKKSPLRVQRAKTQESKKNTAALAHERGAAAEREVQA